jgi:hypothetical protein
MLILDFRPTRLRGCYPAQSSRKLVDCFRSRRNSNGYCVSTVAVARVLYRLIDGGSRKRRVCPETQSGSDKCNAAIVPQRLHGSLLKRSDRRRARSELSEAEPRKSFARVPNRRQSDFPGIATGNSVYRFSESSGSSYACAKYVHAKYVRTKYVRTERARGRGAANRDSAAECCWSGQAQPGATQKRSAVLWRRLQDPLLRDSTGRLGLDCLSEAQHHDLVGNVQAGISSRCRGCYRGSRSGRCTGAS